MASSSVQSSGRAWVASSASSQAIGGLPQSSSLWDSSGGFFGSSDDNFGFGGGGDDDYGPDAKDKYFSSKDCIVMLVDSGPWMLRSGALGDALRCAAGVMTDKVISAEDDLVGVCLYNTAEERKEQQGGFTGVSVLADVDVPDARRILELEKMGGSADPPKGAAAEGTPVLPVLSDALWACSTMFASASARGAKIGSKRVFLFTNDSSADPGNSGQRSREQCLQRARDLADLGITIELFAMSSSKPKPDVPAPAPAPADRDPADGLSARFGGEAFYCELLVANGDERAAEGIDATAKFDELREHVRRKEFKKRTVVRMPLVLGVGPQGTCPELSVKLYLLQHKTERGRFVTLDSRTNQPLRATTQWVSEDTGALLMPNQFKHAFLYGGERIAFEKEELDAIKSVEQRQCVRVLGFKPRASLKPYHNIKHASFLYPDERMVKGSTVAFTALLEQMLSHDTVAIARVTPREKAPPRLAALVPQREVYEDGTMTVPPGFHLIPLPYADDLRTISLPETEVGAGEDGDSAKPTRDDIVNAKRIVKRLRIDFSSRNFDNPTLQRHYAALQALALDRDKVEPVGDLLLPDTEGMAQFSSVVTDFVRGVFPPGYECITGTPAAAKKRPRSETAGKRGTASEAAGSSEGGPARKKKAAEVSADEVDWVQAVANGSIVRASVQLLKEFLRGHGVKFASKDKKEQLLDIAREYIRSCGDAVPVSSHAVPVDVPAAADPNLDDDDDPDYLAALEEAARQFDEVQANAADASGAPVVATSSPAPAAVAPSSVAVASASIAPVPSPGDESDEEAVNDGQPICKYGMGCYRNNPKHFEEFYHPPGHPKAR